MNVSNFALIMCGLTIDSVLNWDLYRMFSSTCFVDLFFPIWLSYLHLLKRAFELHHADCPAAPASGSLSVNVSVCLSVCLSVCPSVRLSVHPSFFSAFLSVLLVFLISSFSSFPPPSPTAFYTELTRLSTALGFYHLDTWWNFTLY